MSESEKDFHQPSYGTRSGNKETKVELCERTTDVQNDSAVAEQQSLISSTAGHSALRKDEVSYVGGWKKTAAVGISSLAVLIMIFTLKAPEDGLERATWNSDPAQAIRLLAWFLVTIVCCVFEPFPLSIVCLLSASGAVFFKILPLEDEQKQVPCIELNANSGFVSPTSLNYEATLVDLLNEVGEGGAGVPFAACKKWVSALPWTPLVGFSHPTLWLIVLAFMLSASLEKSGLAKRIGWMIVGRFGGSILRLGYSIALCEVAFALLIPSNTARGAGVILPILLPLLKDTLGSDPANGTERRAGTYLILLEIALNNKLAQIFCTASANSALIYKYASDLGEEISFLQWAWDMILHMALQILLCPLVLYYFYRPTADDDISSARNKRTSVDREECLELCQDSTQQKDGHLLAEKLRGAAVEKLSEMGRLSRNEVVTLVTLLCTIALWAGYQQVAFLQHLDTTVIALAAIGALLGFGIIDIKEDVAGNAAAWNMFLWFGVLVMMSGRLQDLGVFGWLATWMARIMNVGSPYGTVIISSFMYGISSYLFASTTARTTAIWKVFVNAMSGSGGCGVPLSVAVRAMTVMTGTGYLTPYSNAVNVPMLASGYVKDKPTVYLAGALMFVLDLLVLLTLDCGWWWLLGHWRLPVDE